MNDSTKSSKSTLEPSSEDSPRRSVRWKRTKRIAIVLVVVFVFEIVLTMFGTLHAAARSGSVVGVAVQLVAGLGMNVNKRKRDQYKGIPRTPMMVAAENGHLAVVRLLTLFGGETSERLSGMMPGSACYSPLCLAVQNEHTDIVRFLIERGALAPEGFPAKISRDPLPLASHIGNLELVEMIVETNALDLDYRDALGRAVIGCQSAQYKDRATRVVGSENDYVKVMRILCENGADPNIAIFDTTVLHEAVGVDDGVYSELLTPYAAKLFHNHYPEYVNNPTEIPQFVESIQNVRKTGWESCLASSKVGQIGCFC